jgi:hypothetical protein
MSKNPGVCRLENCRSIGQLRELPYPQQGSNPGPTQSPLEVCGAHWPEVRAKIADRAQWRAVLRDGSLSFDAVAGRS